MTAIQWTFIDSLHQISGNKIRNHSDTTMRIENCFTGSAKRKQQTNKKEILVQFDLRSLGAKNTVLDRLLLRVSQVYILFQKRPVQQGGHF